MLQKIRQYHFLFSELVKRDFTKKYKRTVLGMAWSILSPLMTLLIMWLVFSNFFGNSMKHYVIYLFTGQLVFAYFTDSTNLCMNALVNNASIFTKVNVPKYLFLLSQNVSSLINFGLTLILLFVFSICHRDIPKRLPRLLCKWAKPQIMLSTDSRLWGSRHCTMRYWRSLPS